MMPAPLINKTDTTDFCRSRITFWNRKFAKSICDRDRHLRKFDLRAHNHEWVALPQSWSDLIIVGKILAQRQDRSWAENLIVLCVSRFSFNFDNMSKFLTDRRSVFQRKRRVFEKMLAMREGEQAGKLGFPREGQNFQKMWNQVEASSSVTWRLRTKNYGQD
jgi:hypothetical protein